MRRGDIVSKLEEESISVNMPWLILKLQESYFAINSRDVTGIFRVEEDVVPVPDSKKNMRGIINMRGDVIPVMELRAMLGMISFAEEHKNFSDMLEMRKCDHVNWVEELKRCVEQGIEFTLTTNPHMCAFGKWYDNYKTTNPTIDFHLKKLNEPHCKVHETAIDIYSCNDIKDEQERKQKISDLLKQETTVYMPKIMNLIDETKEVIESSYKEMCVVIKDSTSTLGLLVDEVVSVEDLEFIDNVNGIKSTSQQTSFVESIAQRITTKQHILVLNKEALFNSI